MAAIDFPNSPATNDTFTVGTRTWKYDGAKWNVVVMDISTPFNSFFLLGS